MPVDVDELLLAASQLYEESEVANNTELIDDGLDELFLEASEVTDHLGHDAADPGRLPNDSTATQAIFATAPTRETPSKSQFRLSSLSNCFDCLPCGHFLSLLYTRSA